MELKGHADSVDQLCWDPKHADLLATASGDKTVRLWDARCECRKYFCILVYILFCLVNYKINGYVIRLCEDFSFPLHIPKIFQSL